MKNLIFKSSFHEKLKVLIIPMMLLTLGVGQMWATYYYRGEKNSWGATEMTDVNGIYSYYSATSGAHQFKISTSTSSYDYNYTYVTKNYKQTDVSNIGDYSSNNCYCWQSSAHYILVFNPNTSVNSTNKPIICAATALPSAGFESDGNTISYYNNVDGDKQSSALDRENGTTIDLTSKSINSLYLKAFNTKMYQHYEVNLLDKTAYHFYYKIHRTAEAAGSTGFTEITSADGYSAGSVTWGSFDGSKYRKPTYYVTANQSLLSGLGSGLYTMSYYFTHVGTTVTYRLPSTSSKYNELKWKIPVPAVTSGAVTSDGTGTGESATPFTVADGSTITFTATGSQASTDANSVLYVKWGSDDYAPAASTTKTLTPTTTKQSMTVKLKYYNSADDLSGTETTLTIYYQSTANPSIGISTISPSPANSGDEITITASRQNAGTANITYQYSLNGTSGWTAIGSATSSTTKTWTVPAITATTTYYFRAQMTYSSVTYTSDVVSLKAYGKKTIKVRDTNGWGDNFKIHRWGGDAEGTTWPGETTNITSAGGQWKQVVLYSSSTDFLFDKSSDPDHNKTANQTYAGMTDGNCYEIQSGTGGSLTLSSATCPSAPSVTTASATSVATTSATFNASGVNANNDAITEYGFKWGTTSACSSGTVAASNLGTGTTFSASKSSLTNGTTYYFKAYATNGQGTTYGDPVSVRTKFITTVTLNKQGGLNGTSEVTATEGSAMPSGKTAPEKTGYTFGGYYASAGGSGKQYYNSSMGSANNWDVAASTAEIHAKWTAITYTVKFNGNGNTGGTMSNQTGIAYDSETTLTANAFTRTGYTFQGWATSKARADAGTVDRTDGAAHGNLSSTQGATVNLYAVWQANTYTISFSQSGEGYGSGGQTANKTATYDAAMPTTISLPTAATGYAFMGYYDVLSPLGTQYYDASGNSAHNWDKTSNTTLYAYFKKAEITGFTFSTGSSVVAPSTNMTVTATLSPTPQPTTHIDWRILHSNDNPLDNQPSFGTGITTNTFASPTTSGMYKMEATLRTGNVANAGTVLSTYTASFQVAGDHTVTLQYKCGDETIKASTTMTGKPLVWTSVTAPEIFGYTFSKWIPGDGISIRKGSTEDTVRVATTATIQIKAIYDGKLTAIYTQNSYIYFKNTLGWSSVYVNFLGDWGYWNNPKGSGNKNVTNRNKQMTQIEGTNIWYYDYGTASITPTLYVSFTEDLQNGDGSGAENFWKTGTGENVVYPANYPDDIHTDKSSENGFKAATPMFVPISQDPVVLNSSGGGKANYYNAGYWTKYTPGTGYTLEIYYSDGSKKIKEVEFTSADDLMPMKAVVDLEASSTYKFQVRRGGTESAGVYYGNKGTMTYKDHGQSTAWEMINTMSPSFSMASITTNAAGDYTFNLSYSAASNQYRLRMAVDYPIAGGDYRVIYKHTGQTNWKASAIVPKVNNGKDTVSFFIRPGQTPYMKIQQATVNSTTGAVTWSDYYSVPTATLAALSGDKVYNACITMNASGGASVEKIEPYTGNYYIRTDCANSKWDNYRSDQDHLMTYSEYSIDHGGYSHYYCHWVQTDDRKNIKFTIANDYNPGLSDTLTRETASGTWEHISDFVESNGDIKRNTNVRFMWNQSTNAVSRAYVDGAQEDGSQFLVISSTDEKIQKADGSTLDDNKVTFSDNENWIYEANVQAKPQAAYKLISSWGKTGETDHIIDQYFKGSSTTTETLIDGSGTDWYDIRLLYDFKTNRLVAAWVPSDANITTDNAINADVMFIREHQGDIAQLTFGDAGKISKITTAYGVMRFNKYTLANKDKSTHNPLGSPASVYERSLFWISFPFRVKLSEVFGFGTYGTHWAIQYYDGADRAARGHFQENGSFWKWMNRSTAYLEPNQGYLLAIDLDLLGESSNVWGPESKSSQIELYFPSYGTMPDITNADVAQTIPSHECTINWYESGKVPGPDTKDPRTSYNRTIFDSHWNVISVPTYVNTDDVTFANPTWTAAGKMGPKFLYTWNADDNTITATTASGYTYHAMHAYMTQYCGGITWSAKSGSPASVVARRAYADEPKEIEFNLELQQNEKTIDRAFVVLSADEEVSAGFQFGEDMTKEFNASRSAIYTFIPDVAAVAGNTLPMSDQTTVVPVGVDIIAEGEYIISLPEGTSGVGVTLIDNELQTRTNLALTDYAVTLPVGTYDERFVLEISPIEQTTTGVEAMNGANGDASLNGVCKKLIDGVLYIVKDGKVFDARGARIQ